MAVEGEHQLQTNGHAKQAEESANSVQSKELRKKKRKKFLIFVALSTLFQIAVTLFSSLYIMKVRTPKFRIRSATFDVLSKNAENSSFNITMNAEFGVKNANFGPYKYRDSTIYFFYNGVNIGEAFVSHGKAGFKSTKIFNVLVNLSSKDIPKDSKLRNDTNSETLTLTSKSKLEGKVALIFVLKKKKSTEMDCTITVGLADKVIRDIDCD
ncbi:late embryogenesis abundant protein At1g64065-like [Nicotiana tabacum]|uniref:Late embryogenesis abundant protein At1g64065-like n=1 Tax=Nicotiana tabacum TaxID=4097 RepID=A0AC58UBT8_TOBAC